jgi:FtsP/CotA-like multicopper oxidase with cupredoxin domain
MYVPGHHALWRKNVSAKDLSRRDFIRAGLLGSIGLAGAAALLSGGRTPVGEAHPTATTTPVGPGPSGAGMAGMDMGGTGHAMVMPDVNGEVDHVANGFNPSDTLTDFNRGEVSTLPNGQTLREFEINAVNKDIEVVPGIHYPAWVYNGRIPGPILRVTEGDRVRIHFGNGGDHPHSLHFHGVHTASMDGVPDAGMVEPGDTFTYEFDAEPFGLHLFHCHTPPLAKHISKGLYGVFIIDPKVGRPPADHEFVMVMHGLDIDFDEENDFYAVNGIPFHYQKHPIRFKIGELVRIYLVNILEFDPVNSFHIHANFFHYYPTGTSLTPTEYTDTVIQGQAQRGILEFRYKYPGLYMFHAHKTEFAELGWTGLFQVEEA